MGGARVQRQRRALRRTQPPFPLLQAEKVLSPPLSIDLDERYRYRLRRPSTGPAWVVGVETLRRDQSLYRGTVWIDRQPTCDYVSRPCRRRSSSSNTQDFAPVRTPSGGEVWLPSRIYNQQLFLVAGRNLLVERRIALSDYEIAPGDFAGQRQEARGGARTMYRDTDDGVRYFAVKEAARTRS